jgi:hypothetical protein
MKKKILYEKLHALNPRLEHCYTGAVSNLLALPLILHPLSPPIIIRLCPVSAGNFEW